MLFNYLKNERGMALALVILVMAVLTMTGTMLLTMSSAETNFSVNSEKQMRAEYVAKSGADIEAQYFLADPETTHNGGTYVIGSGSAQVTVSKPDINTVLITSIGTVGNASRTVHVKLTKKVNMDIFTGIRASVNQSNFDLGALTLRNNSSQPMILEANVPNASNILTGSVTGTGGVEKRVNNTPLDPIDIDGIDTTGFTTASSIGGSIILSGNYEIEGQLSKGNNENLVFEVEEGEEMTIITDTINFDGPHGTVSISGGGIVRIYLRNGGAINNPLNANTPANGLLFIYIAENKILDLQSNCDLGAYIYGAGAMIAMNSSGTTVHGSIVGEVIQRNPTNSNGPHGVLDFVPLPSGYTGSEDHGYYMRMYY